MTDMEPIAIIAALDDGEIFIKPIDGYVPQVGDTFYSADQLVQQAKLIDPKTLAEIHAEVRMDALLEAASKCNDLAKVSGNPWESLWCGNCANLIISMAEE